LQEVFAAMELSHFFVCKLAFLVMSFTAAMTANASAEAESGGENTTLASSPLGNSAPKKLATLCTEGACRLPDCFCSGTRVPKGLKPSTIPQFVMVSFDGAINDVNFKNYERIFGEGRRNPDGCPIRGTFFVNHEWTDYWLTNALYVKGHEIASHTITRESMPAFQKADLDRWVKEIGGMKKILEIFGGIPAKDIKGFRAPFLHPGGDDMFEALNRSGLSWDSSLIAGENNPPMWPYSLEYKSSQDCKVGPCPRNSHPGIWEVPLVQQMDDSEIQRVCSMIDACQDRLTKLSAYNMLLDNFMRHYTSNRAPFPVFMRTWFHGSQYRFDAFLEFLDTIQMLPDVYVVTISDVLNWIQNPTPCERPEDEGETANPACRLAGLKNWSCRDPEVAKRRPACPLDRKQDCMFKNCQNRDRRVTSCQSCNGEYPWLGNPDGSLFKITGEEIKSEERPFWFAPRGLNLTVKAEEKPKEDPFASFKKMNPKDRLRQYLRKRMKNFSTNQNVFARVMSDVESGRK